MSTIRCDSRSNLPMHENPSTIFKTAPHKLITFLKASQEILVWIILGRNYKVLERRKEFAIIFKQDRVDDGDHVSDVRGFDKSGLAQC